MNANNLFGLARLSQLLEEKNNDGLHIKGTAQDGSVSVQHKDERQPVIRVRNEPPEQSVPGALMNACCKKSTT